MTDRVSSSAKSPIHFVDLRIASPVHRDELKMAIIELDSIVASPTRSKKELVDPAKRIGHWSSVGISRRQSKHSCDSTWFSIRVFELGVFTRQLPYILHITSSNSTITYIPCRHHGLRVGKFENVRVGARKCPVSYESHPGVRSPTS